MIISGEEQSPCPDSVNSKQTLDGYLLKSPPPPPTDTLDSSFPVPDEAVDVQQDKQEEVDVVCPSPINTYSGYLSDDTKPLSSQFSTKKSRSSSPVLFDDKASMVVCLVILCLF